MPKILINEKDKTSPGTPGSYSNYAVLIAGFRGEATKPTVKAESNGVYEFSSAQDFEDTIGLAAPQVPEEKTDGATVYHYGNQMAYELLNLGYSVIYRPINSINELTDDKTWEIFRDKASYDFRFVTHGLLESSSISEEPDYINLNDRLDAVKAAMDELLRIEDSFAPDEDETDLDLALAEFCNEEYAKVRDAFDGFLNLSSNTRYEEYSVAKASTRAEYDEKTAQKTLMEGHNITEAKIIEANGCIANLAQYVADKDTDEPTEKIPGRGDCIALIELDEKQYAGVSSNKPEDLIISAINRMSSITQNNGKYCAMTVPSVYYSMADDERFGNNKKFPGAFHYLACFIRSLGQGFAEWYAAAGYTRGVSSFTVDHTSVKLGEIAINALEPRYLIDDENTVQPSFSCNVIANFRGSYYLWGNRTAEPLGSKAGGNDLVASHFLNIRQLCTTIKKQLYVACRRFTFDPNSDTLWFNFVNAIKPTLEAMKADQGIRDYKIQKVYTDKKATLKAKIRIIPIEAVEDFSLEVSLEDSFGETTAVVNE